MAELCLLKDPLSSSSHSTGDAAEMDRCNFSSLPTEIRNLIIEELLSSHDEFRICTKYVPRPLERTPGRRIIYKTSLPMQLFQIDRRTRDEAISALSKAASTVDLRYCSAEFVVDINKLPPSALRNALNSSVVDAHLGRACVTDFSAFRQLFARLQHLTLDQLGSDTPYGRARIRGTDGFSVHKDLIPFLRGDFDAEFETLARQDISNFLMRQSIDIEGLKLEIPFRFSVPRSVNDTLAGLRNCFPGRVLVFAVAHDESETKIASKYFSKFEVKNTRSHPTHTPAVIHVPLDTAKSQALRQSLTSYEIRGINDSSHESIEIHHWGYCGTGLFHAFDGWLNDRYDYTWRA